MKAVQYLYVRSLAQWGGGGARPGTSPSWDFPSTLSDLPSISFLRGSDIAQSSLVSSRRALMPLETSPCLDWAPPWEFERRPNHRAVSSVLHL